MTRKNGDEITRLQDSYRWECPICEETNLGFAAEKTSREAALNALKSHVRAVDGDGHGPENRLPRDLDPEALHRTVRVDDESE